MSLRSLTRQHLLDDMLGSVDGEFKVLIVDRYTMLLLASCCKNSEVVSKNVVVIESLHITRQPLPAYPALYFLTPKEESVELLIDDWKGERPYLHAHVFFTNRLPDALIDSIGRSRCGKYLRTLKEINLDFFCPESQLFTFNVEHDVLQLLGPKSTQEQHALVADHLVTVCCTLNEDPIIRFQNTSSATLVASFLQEKIDLYGRLNPKYKLQCNPNRAVLIILDRSVDCAAPLLHEFTYQAMLYDLVTNGLKDTKYLHSFVNSAGKTIEKEVTLDDNDPLWTEFRHRHISEVLPELNSSLQSFLQNNKAITSLTKEKREKDLKKMSEAVRQMPQYQQKVDNFSLHIGISGKLIELYKQRCLEATALCEQLMATGELADGTKASEKDVRKDLEKLLVSTTASADDKLRLLLLYAISQGNEADASQLLPVADMGPIEGAAISNITHFRPPEEKVKKSFFSKTKKKKVGRAAVNKDAYDVSRYVPALKGVLEAEVGAKLSPADFPYTKEPPVASAVKEPAQAAPTGKSLRGNRGPQWTSSRGSSSSTVPENDLSKLQLSGPRLIVFVVGGVTYSEIRSAYEVMRESKREVIVGGTSILTPHGFVEEMKLFGS
eukprot:GGOE01054770.1.p1 GENE.GGOE01054770.1~~GGOE01054770.1.p1  ORF type:complete len:609 (+),score=216.48 GGOE01054770.1:92-1918(+)